MIIVGCGKVYFDIMWEVLCIIRVVIMSLVMMNRR